MTDIEFVNDGSVRPDIWARMEEKLTQWIDTLSDEARSQYFSNLAKDLLKVSK